MKYFLSALLVIVIVGGTIFFGATPLGRATWNRWFHAVQKADDAARYQTRKGVEDTCRAMMASYTADQLRYEQYSASTDPEQRGWGEQAKMRANQTAATYNEYVLKNSYVFEGNVPMDIRMNLPYID